MRKKGDCPVALLGCVKPPDYWRDLIDPLAALFVVLIVESFLQAIKNQAVGALYLVIGPRVSH
jgi:hypothetical protein